MAKANRANLLEIKRKKKLAVVDVWQSRAARMLVLLLLCVHPLYMNAQRYGRLTQQKFEFFALCVCVTLVAVFIIWLFRLLGESRLLPMGKPSVADWALLGFAAVTLVSALVSPFKELVDVWLGITHPGGRYDGAITQLLYVSAFFIISRWYKPRELDFVIFSISAMLVSLIGILQFYGLDFLGLWPNHIEAYYVENFYDLIFRSTIGNINVVSTYMCVAILLCGFLYVKVASKWRFVWLAGSALSFWMLVIGSSFSGMVGTAAATFLAVPFIIENRKVLGRFLILIASWAMAFALQMLFYNVIILGTGSVLVLALAFTMAGLLSAGGAVLVKLGTKRAIDDPKVADSGGIARWKLGVILLAAAIVVGFVGVELLGRSENTGPIYQAREILHGNIDDTFGTNRVFIWRNALAAFPQHPIIGSGPDTFGLAFPDEAQWYYGEMYDKAHNEYIQILICQCILGFLCYLVFLGDNFRKAVVKALRNPMLMAVLAAFVGYCVQAFFNISTPIASHMLWVCAGILACKRFREHLPPVDDTPTELQPVCIPPQDDATSETVTKDDYYGKSQTRRPTGQ